MKLILTVVVLGLVFTESVLSANLACGATAATKIVTIESPASPPMNCMYTIKPSSTKICQLRVVLEEFNLSPPTTIGNGHPICRHDIFSVSDLRLCGMNKNQHFYVTSTNANAVVFSLLLSSRVTYPTLDTAKWKMTITQLECPTGLLGRGLLGDDVIETVADQQKDLHAQQMATAATPDGYYLAPIGCLQYFPDATGTVESFNLNTDVGPYYSDFKYSICFGRGANQTYVRLTPVLFKMGITAATTDGLDSDCYTQAVTSGRQEDYLFLPFAVLANGRRGTQFCGTSLQNVDYVDIKPPGPFVINVISDEHYNSETDIGFKFNYQIL